MHYQNKGMCRALIAVLLAILIFISGASSLFAVEQDLVDENNEFGGRTFEISNPEEGFSIRIYYDDDEIKIKEETLFSIDYPIENGLDRIISYFAFDKKVKEERIFSNKIAESTLIKKIVDHFDRFADPKDPEAIVRTENHFLDAYNGYNVVYRENGKKTRIEWFYPMNIDGIKHNIIYFDDREMGVKVESFYTEKTTREKGYRRRLYFNEYSPNKYFRKSRQETYYTDEYARSNNGIAKQIEIFHYAPGQKVRVEVNRFNRKGEKIRE